MNKYNYNVRTSSKLIASFIIGGTRSRVQWAAHTHTRRSEVIKRWIKSLLTFTHAHTRTHKYTYKHMSWHIVDSTMVK